MIYILEYLDSDDGWTAKRVYVNLEAACRAATQAENESRCFAGSRYTAHRVTSVPLVEES